MGNEKISKTGCVALIILFLLFLASNIYLASSHKFSTAETGKYFLFIGCLIGGFLAARAISRSDIKSRWKYVLGIIVVVTFIVLFNIITAIETEVAFVLGLIIYVVFCVAIFYYIYTQIKK